jgi:hypothetical protein
LIDVAKVTVIAIVIGEVGVEAATAGGGRLRTSVAAAIVVEAIATVGVPKATIEAEVGAVARGAMVGKVEEEKEANLPRHRLLRLVRKRRTITTTMMIRALMMTKSYISIGSRI